MKTLTLAICLGILSLSAAARAQTPVPTPRPTPGPAASAEFTVDTLTLSDLAAPAVAIGADDGFVVTWMSPQDGYRLGIFARRFDKTGAPIGRRIPGQHDVERYPVLPLDRLRLGGRLRHRLGEQSERGLLGRLRPAIRR